MRLNIDRDLVKQLTGQGARHLDELSDEPAIWSVAILFWQLSIDHIVNVQYKRRGFAKTRLRQPNKAGCSVKLSYKKGSGGYSFDFNLHAWNYKKIPSCPQSLEVFGRLSSPLRGYADIWLKRVVSLQRVRFSGLVSKLEYNFYQSVIWTGNGVIVGVPWFGCIVPTINCYCFKIEF